MVYAVVGTGWLDGADLTEIDAARQALIQDMKTLEAIAPESGAYFNEVRAPHNTASSFSHLSLCRTPIGLAIRV